MLITEAKTMTGLSRCITALSTYPTAGNIKSFAVPKDTEAMLGDDQLLVPAESIVTLRAYRRYCDPGWCRSHCVFFPEIHSLSCTHRYCSRAFI